MTYLSLSIFTCHMMHKLFYYKSLVVLLLICNLQLRAQHWPAVTKEAKPWTRWWWMGSAVDEKGLHQQLSSLHNVGFGGVAVVPIYGAIGYEKKYLKYLKSKGVDLKSILKL